MASGERFYLLELTHRPAVYGDLGSILRIQGLVIGGEGAQAILMLPGESVFDGKCAPPVHGLSLEEWTNFLAQTDNPEILVMPQKAFHRKVRYEISGAVQQKIWVADGLKCMYCSRMMGHEVQLTMDHFIPLEMGGKNDTSNYISACRQCNKRKGSMPPEDWCASSDKIPSYEFYVNYLANRKLP
jgi:hypothetical protein